MFLEAGLLPLLFEAGLLPAFLDAVFADLLLPWPALLDVLFLSS